MIYLASTLTLSLYDGSNLSASNAVWISFLAIEENLALNTLYFFELGMFLLHISSTSKQIFSPSLSQSSQRTMKSTPELTA